ncbi:alpha/beta hydrolase [Actinomadura opuntiae]|uniref:alpha/beta hydrolase n=1 Tax=Actinomadura sp. OS1-43 TaxID=604315 RepID=UPI00255AA180|nr:alpha/beta hydrolase fold domain-containing protein [Actinomadura sp. OS1-43]MDL4815721.1 alpha/beta hydrolase fold domain-containing protein [Actinomadura sp. OS1-43]
MRKVLVSGAAFAATCVSAVAVPMAAQATTPGPSPTPSVSAPTGTPGTDAPTTGSPGSGSPGSQTPGTGSPSGTPSTGAADGEPQAGGVTTDGVVRAKAVMVTPRLPRSATYAYGPSASQRVDAYWRPSAAGNAKTGRTARAQGATRPGVLIVHGGYWLSGSKDSWKYFARKLSDAGYVVLAANYRLAPKAQWPAQRNDALAALTFMKKHAATWNLDPDRIVVLGSSSGGQLATQIGTHGTGTDLVRGVVALSPPNNPFLAYKDGAAADASARQRKLRRAVVGLVHCAPGSVDATPAAAGCWKRVEDADSTTHASAGDAPMLLMHATGDFVPVTQSQGLASALRAAGVQVRVQTVRGDLHASDMLNVPGVTPEILRWIKAHTKARP